MGNSGLAISQEQQDQVAVEADEICRYAGVDSSGAITLQDWKKVFSFLDANDDKVVSRKEWMLQQQSTEFFDALHKKNAANVMETEWHQAFLDLDTDMDNKISLQDWKARKAVALTMLSTGFARSHWGVQIGDQVFEVPIPGEGQDGSEMVVLNSDGAVAFGGDLAENEAKRVAWMELMLGYTTKKVRPESSWNQEKSQPTSLPSASWEHTQPAGWTVKSEEEIATWAKAWVAQHPDYIALHPLGKEANNQTFCQDLITFVTNTPFSKWTDQTKGRIAVGVTAAVVVGGGIAAYALSRRSKPDGAAATPPASEGPVRDQ